jgi:hypothetical protein
MRRQNPLVLLQTIGGVARQLCRFHHAVTLRAKPAAGRKRGRWLRRRVLRHRPPGVERIGHAVGKIRVLVGPQTLAPQWDAMLAPDADPTRVYRITERAASSDARA